MSVIVAFTPFSFGSHHNCSNSLRRLIKLILYVSIFNKQLQVTATEAYIQEPEIQMPSDVYAVKGSGKDAVLLCRIAGFTPPDRSTSGTAPWSITWRKVGDDFSLVTNYMGITYSKHGDRYQFQNVSEGSGVCSLVIRDFDESDAGNYTVEVSYRESKVKHVQLHIVEQSYPKKCDITSQKPVKVIESESDVKLICTFYDSFPFVDIDNVTWAKNALVIPQFRKLDKDQKLQNSQWKNYRITNHGNRAVNAFDLTIVQVNRRDAGVYSCSAIGQFGKPITCDYDLRISFAPEASFSIHENYFAKEGQMRSFECLDKANSYPTPTLVIEKLEENKVVPLMESESHFLKFSINEARVSDAGSYRCRANNSEGTSEVVYELLVQYLYVELRRFKNNSTVNESLLVSENDTVQLECLSRSYPRARLRWLDPEGSVLNQTESSPALLLNLPAISRLQGGLYRCLATVSFYDNSNLTKVQQVAINVKNTPRIISVTPDTPHFLEEGKSLELVCVFTDGVPSASAKWVFNNLTMSSIRKTLPGQTSSITLKKSDISRHESGKYSCLVSNSLGSRSEAIVSVTVKYGPELKFRVEPFDKAIDGENRTFVCEDIAISYPVPTISLLYSSDNLRPPLVTARKHKLNYTMRVLKSHTEAFFCRASNDVNSTQAPPITVDVQYQPMVTVKIEHSELKEGEPLFAQCEAVSNPPPRRLYWRLDKSMKEVGALGGKWDPLGATVNSKITLDLSKVDRSQGGSWSCIATNVLHNSRQLTGTANFNVTVYYPPTDLKIRSSLSNDASDQIILKPSASRQAQLFCVFSDGNPPVTVTWKFFRFGQLMEHPSWQPVEKYHNLRQSAITFDDPNESDSGTYCCEIESGKFGKFEACANLTVMFEPDVPSLDLKSQPMPVTLPHTAEFRCEVPKANPSAIIKWYLDGVSHDPTTQGHEKVNYHFKSWSVARIVLSPEKHRQLVWCSSHSEEFPHEKTSYKITLLVNYSPIIQNSSNAYAMEGDPATLICTVISRPVAQVYWYKNNVPITPEYEHEQDMVTKVVKFKDERTVRSELTIRQVTEKNRGDYKCTATNTFGTSQAVVSVLKPHPPRLEDSLLAQFIPDSSVNLSWVPAQSRYPMKTWYQVWYHTSIRVQPSAGFAQVSSTISALDRNSMSEISLVTKLDHNFTRNYAIIPRLQPGNFYHLFVRACNEAGCSDSINRIFDFEPSHSSPSQLVTKEVNLKEMTILEVTLSLVVGCLTIALCYLIGVLVICVKKIRNLEDMTQHIVKIAESSPETNNNSMGYAVKVPMSHNSPKLTIPRSYLAHLDGNSIKESMA